MTVTTNATTSAFPGGRFLVYREGRGVRAAVGHTARTSSCNTCGFSACVFFNFNRSFYPSTSSTPSVRADPRDTSSVVTNYDNIDNAEKVHGDAVLASRLHNVMPCHRPPAGYDKRNVIREQPEHTLGKN